MKGWKTELISSLRWGRSGWTLRQVHAIQLQMADYIPFHGSSYLELHPYLKSKKAIINVKNEDDECFMRSILASRHPQERDAQRVNKYEPFTDELNFEGINFCLHQ